MMNNTIDAFDIDYNWVNINELSGIAVGSSFLLQNVSPENENIIVCISDTRPAISFAGPILESITDFFSIEEGSSAVWLRCSKASAKVQVITGGIVPFQSSLKDDQIVKVTNIQETKDNKTLITDAWYRPKAVFDNSLIHGMFTYSVPVSKWKESIDSVEQTVFTSATSVNGKLVLTTGALNQRIKLETFRNPRYEPNRGHLYSTSIFLPNKDALSERNFGTCTDESGVFFRLRSGILYAVRRTTLLGVTSDIEEAITLPDGVDLEMGNTFDIQFEWRGVGDYFFFINNQLAHVFDVIGTGTELTTFNPAAPIAFECINLGEAAQIECGCVDVTSEGGEDNGKTYGSVSTNSLTGSVAISSNGSYNIPIVVVRNKKSFDSLINTRDVLSLLATAYGDQRCVFRVWATRDETAITLNDQVWSDFGDGHIEKIVYKLNADGSALVGNEMTFDALKANDIFGSRVSQDTSYATSALFEGRTEIYQTPGDIFIFTMHRETGGTCNIGVTYEFAESI